MSSGKSGKSQSRPKIIMLCGSEEKFDNLKLAVTSHAEMVQKKYKDIPIADRDTNWNIHEKNLKNLHYNEPNSSYWGLFSIMEYVLAHCEKHKIPIFAEYGTLLGISRHNGIIPWDWDGDYGVMEEYREKLSKSFEIDPLPKYLVMNKALYKHDDGTFCFTWKDNDDDMVDVVFYKCKCVSLEELNKDILFYKFKDEDNLKISKILNNIKENQIETSMSKQIIDELLPLKNELLPLKKYVWL